MQEYSEILRSQYFAVVYCCVHTAHMRIVKQVAAMGA